MAIVGLTVVNSIFVILLGICTNVGLTFFKCPTIADTWNVGGNFNAGSDNLQTQNMTYYLKEITRIKSICYSNKRTDWESDWDTPLYKQKLWQRIEFRHAFANPIYLKISFASTVKKILMVKHLNIILLTNELNKQRNC